jgi:hypothetical protein
VRIRRRVRVSGNAPLRERPRFVGSRSPQVGWRSLATRRYDGRVTHEEIRTLLPRYAGGVLAMVDAEVVRAHLASGCTDCLDVLYRMPVGMPRTVEAASAPSGSGGAAGTIPPPAGPASGTTYSWLRRVVGVAVAVALIAWAVSVWGAAPTYGVASPTSLPSTGTRSVRSAKIKSGSLTQGLSAMTRLVKRAYSAPAGRYP